MTDVRVGFMCGSFDLLHTGHVLMLEEAKSHCDRLIVGLQVDPTIDGEEKPIMTLEERHIMLKSIRWVDEVRTYSTTAELISLLKSVNPSVRIVDPVWRGKEFPGFETPIRTIFSSEPCVYFSSLRERVAGAEFERHATASLAPHIENIKKMLQGRSV